MIIFYFLTISKKYISLKIKRKYFAGIKLFYFIGKYILLTNFIYIYIYIYIYI